MASTLLSFRVKSLNDSTSFLFLTLTPKVSPIFKVLLIGARILAKIPFSLDSNATVALSV